MRAAAPLALAVALLGSGPARAQVDCGRMPDQISASQCARDNWDQSDAELNRLWAVVKPAADARGAGGALLAEQRAWLRARDARCEAERDAYAGGSIAAQVYWSCMDAMTRARNRELEALR